MLRSFWFLFLGKLALLLPVDFVHPGVLSPNPNAHVTSNFMQGQVPNEQSVYFNDPHCYTVIRLHRYT